MHESRLPLSWKLGFQYIPCTPMPESRRIVHLQSDSPRENGWLMNNLSAEQVINGRNPKPPAPVGIVLKFLVISGEQFIEINTSFYQHSSKKSLDLEKIGPLVF